MQSGTSSDGAPSDIRFTDSERADLLSSLNDWLGILDRVLTRELSAERREELARGAAELREIVDEMLGARRARGES
ncbi:MAG: hypothetical protein H7Z40_23915 [Phycisphaerae bacterium]|nr:hypothetical protein [Gemmatimonadaceae bacterium]